MFDLGLKESIHTRLLFLQRLLASISDKSCSKLDLVFDGIVIFTHYKMVNLDSITNENKRKWSYVPDHPYRINASGSGKINALINLMN